MSAPVKLVKREVPLKAVALCVAALCPFVFLIAMIARYGYDAPFMDGWAIVPVLNRLFNGTLTTSDLWESYNGHRIFFGKLFMVLLARFSHFNPYCELYTTVLFAIAVLLLIAFQLRATARELSQPFQWGLFPLISLMVFSLNQWQIYLWGWHLLIYWCVLATMAWALLIARVDRHWGYLAAAAVAGAVATFSWGPGLIVWPASLLVIVMMLPAIGRRKTSLYAAVWAVFAAVTAAAYLYHYVPNNQTGAELSALRRPFEFIAYVATFLGTPLMGAGEVEFIGARLRLNVAGVSEPGAMVIGAAGIVLCAALFAIILREKQVKTSAWAPYMALILHAIGNAVFTAFERLNFGREQAMSPRYIAFSNFFWFGLLGLLLIYAYTCPNPRRRIVYRSAASAIACLVIVGAAFGAYCADERHNGFVPARNALIEGKDDALLKRLYPDVNRLRQWREMLVQHRLSVFREK